MSTVSFNLLIDGPAQAEESQGGIGSETPGDRAKRGGGGGLKKITITSSVPFPAVLLQERCHLLRKCLQRFHLEKKKKKTQHPVLYFTKPIGSASSGCDIMFYPAGKFCLHKVSTSLRANKYASQRCSKSSIPKVITYLLLHPCVSHPCSEIAEI